MGGSSLRIRLLGGLDVDGVDVAAFGSRKARTLLKRLALDAGRPVPIDTLVATLWPDDDGPERPADQVSVLVSRLRRVLGSETITYSDGAYSLAATWLDIDELRERADEAARRLTAGNPALARAAAAAALALVRGPLLPEDSDEPWTEATRSAVDRQIARTRQVAAEGALAGRLPWEAVEHAAAALAADPYDEAALRLLMRAQVAAGRPALALAAYAETAALVATDLGVDLSAESRAVHAEVLRGDLEAATPSAPADVPPLIGRDRELAALEAAFDRARAGSAAVVTVEGEAGIGKTRLLTSFADRVSPAADVLWGTAGAVGVLPLEPVLDALAGRLASATDDDRAALLGAEAELLGLLLRAGTAAADPTAYGEFLRAYEPGDQSAPAVLHVAVLSVVARLAARRPVVLLLDDVHLADAATLAWLGFIARRGSGLRVLVVAARRPDTRQVPGEEPILVDRLDATAAAAVVSPYLAADRVEAVVARSAGLPLFLVELAHSGGGELPDSIRDAVVERLADAGAATATLHAAAVLGNEIDVDLLATVLDVPASQLLDHLDDGARRRILDDAPTGYVFRHDLVREALEADTPSARRAWLHREAARTLSRRRPAEQLRVAHHARLGGDAPLAAAALCAAAEQSGARFDHSEALRLAEASLELVETPDAHLIRGRSLVMLRRYAEARDAAHRAHTLGADGVALEVAAFASYYARDLDAVLAFADQAQLTSEDPEVLDTCQFLAIKVLHTQGKLGEATARLTPITAGPPRSRIAPFAQTWRCLVELHRGHLADADAALASADLAARAPVPYAPLYVDQFTTHLASLRGRPLDALAAADRLSAAVAEQGALRFAGRAEVYRGWALSLLGDPAAADQLEAAREAARSTGNPEPLGQATLDLASLRLDRLDRDGAAALLDEADTIVSAGREVSNGWRIELRASYLRGRLAVLNGEADAAAELASAVVARAAPEAIDRYEVLGALLAIEAAAARGEPITATDVAAHLPMLLAVARPEAWRVAARLGHRLDSAELLTWSAARVDELVANAGPWGDTVKAVAAAALNRDR